MFQSANGYGQLRLYLLKLSYQMISKSEINEGMLSIENLCSYSVNHFCHSSLASRFMPKPLIGHVNMSRSKLYISNKLLWNVTACDLPNISNYEMPKLTRQMYLIILGAANWMKRFVIGWKHDLSGQHNSREEIQEARIVIAKISFSYPLENKP